MAVKIDNRSASEMYRAISELYEHFPKETFKTYTVDRGKEFACYSKVEADLKVPVYFADAYSSWQRGSNENANGLLRENFLKKTDLSRITEQEVNEALCLINHRPRKCLGWKTPTHEVVSPFDRESSYFMSKCRICIDNSSNTNQILR